MIFFTADTHFGYENIIFYTKRPFKDREEMNQKLIENWNKVVGKNDVVYHLGDFAFGNFRFIKEIRHRLNGKIHLILGNHDYRNNIDMLKSVFASISDMKEIYIEEYQQLFVLCHYPMRTWHGSHNGSIQLYGHSHGTLLSLPGQMDVGVDSNNFKPLSIEEVIEKIDSEKAGGAISQNTTTCSPPTPPASE